MELGFLDFWNFFKFVLHLTLLRFADRNQVQKSVLQFQHKIFKTANYF